MAILFVPIPGSRRLYSVCPTFPRRVNVALLVPFRLLMWVVHFTCLVLAARASDAMIVTSSLAPGYTQSDYSLLRRTTDLCLAAAFVCLFFNSYGIVSGRTLRFGLSNVLQGACDCAASVLLIVSWQADAHVARIWHVFYVFSIIPTAFELFALLWSFHRGVDVYV